MKVRGAAPRSGKLVADDTRRTGFITATFFLSKPITLGGMRQNDAPLEGGHRLILRTTNRAGSLRMLKKTLEDRASVLPFLLPRLSLSALTP
jgi:hypothetical protein